MVLKGTILNILNRIGDCLFNEGVRDANIQEGLSEVTLAKHTDQRVIGSMTNQKLRYELDIVDPNGSIASFDELERRNNSYPLGVFDMNTSQEIFAETVKKEWPTKP